MREIQVQKLTKDNFGKYFKIFNKNTKNLANRGLARF